MNSLSSQFVTKLIRIVVLSSTIMATSSIATDTTDGDRVRTIEVFANHSIRFAPDEPSPDQTADVIPQDNGRLIARTLDLPPLEPSVRIIAHLTVKPIPKDEVSVHDKWDRAGNVRLAIDGQPDAELVKFITAYGGRTEYRVDITHLSPWLTGEVTIKAFIDTWVDPAWHVDFDLEYFIDSLEETTLWALPVLFEASFDKQTFGDTGVVIDVSIPEGAERTLLHYYVSGHCTDGRGADEFVKKDHVISVDGIVVFRFRPWRDDCQQFRSINPYTRRWSDGWWSSDYSRTGWCPGAQVDPVIIDLSDHLTPGNHTVQFVVENIRPKDEEGDYGYWRISAQLLGVNE